MPKVAFLTNTKMIGHFLDAFADRRRYDRIDLLPAEAQEVERLIASGKSRDEAIAAVGERRALSKVNAKDRETRALNGDMIRRAEAERAKTMEERKRLLREKTTPPTHPSRSEGFDELGDFQLDPIELPELDLSKWN